MKIDRPGAAIIGAVLMFTTGAVRANNALHLIHFGTIVLLFSMMLVVAYLHLAGFFDWVTELVVTRLKPHHLLPTVVFLSGLLSAFFVNDIICLVMVPFVLKVAGRMGIKRSSQSLISWPWQPLRTSEAPRPSRAIRKTF
jgi:Na+/H+ antiporter NhaD/arsenite permease-like protein